MTISRAADLRTLVTSLREAASGLHDQALSTSLRLGRYKRDADSIEVLLAVADAVAEEKARTHDINRYQRALCMRGAGLSCEVCTALNRLEELTTARVADLRALAVTLRATAAGQAGRLRPDPIRDADSIEALLDVVEAAKREKAITHSRLPARAVCSGQPTTSCDVCVALARLTEPA